MLLRRVYMTRAALFLFSYVADTLRAIFTMPMPPITKIRYGADIFADIFMMITPLRLFLSLRFAAYFSRFHEFFMLLDDAAATLFAADTRHLCFVSMPRRHTE